MELHLINKGFGNEEAGKLANSYSLNRLFHDGMPNSGL